MTTKNSRKSWIKNEPVMEKRAGIDIETGEKLSQDTVGWPEEILDILIKKFPFLSNYPIMIRVDKRDEDTKSAFLYGIVTLSGDKKIGIPIVIVTGYMMPVFPFSYNKRFYPLTETAINKILAEDFSLGHPSERPRIDYESPWRFMQKFLQSTMFVKRASVIKFLESIPDEIVQKLIGNEKVASLLGSVRVAEPKLHTKTAFVHGERYEEWVDGKRVRLESLFNKRGVHSKMVKVAAINESIASGTDRVVHEVEEGPVPPKEGKLIAGAGLVPLLPGKTYAVNYDGKNVNAVYVTNHWMSLDPDGVNQETNGAVMYSQEHGFFFMPNVSKMQMSQEDVKFPECKEIGKDDVGKSFILQVKGSDGNIRFESAGNLKTYIEDGKEKIYVFRRGFDRNRENTYVYSPAFKRDTSGNGLTVPSYVGEANYVGSPICGVEADVNGMKVIVKHADDESMTIVRVEPIKGAGQYHFSMTGPSGRVGKGFIFNDAKEEYKEDPFIVDMDDVVDRDTYRGEIEHELVRRGISSSSVAELFDEADSTGSASMMIPCDEKAQEVSEKDVKMASMIHATVKKNLPLRKIAELVTVDRLGDIFSMHLVNPENVGEFMKVIPYIEDVVDYLCRYYIYKNIGLTSESDRARIRNLEATITGMWNVIVDLQKYKSAYDTSEVIQ